MHFCFPKYAELKMMGVLFSVFSDVVGVAMEIVFPFSGL